MGNTNNRSDRAQDSFDELLCAAARESCKGEIDEYVNSPKEAQDPIPSLEQFRENLILKRKSSGRAHSMRKGGHLSFKRRLLVIMAAAIAVTLFAFGSIAGKKSKSAELIVNEDEYVCIVSYDLKGIKTDPELICEVPERYRNENYTVERFMSEEGTDRIHIHDELFSEELYVSVLTGGLEEYTSKSAPDDTFLLDYFPVLVGGVYNGVMFEYEDGFYVLVWNDGKFSYKLAGGPSATSLVDTAEEICGFTE